MKILWIYLSMIGQIQMNNINTILNYLDELIPNPKCELEYNKDYELLIAVMLSAQTTDKRVNQVTKELFKKYNTLDKLKDAELCDIQSYIKILGNYTKKSKAVINIANTLYNKYDKKVPNNRTLLEDLPMVGRKTTNVVLSELYGIPNIAVDTHVERVSKRLKLAKEKSNVLEVENALKRKVPKDKWIRFHHQMVLFGRYYCTAKSPKCNDCKLKDICKHK